MATISNYKGDIFPISENNYFVTATDKVLSDWGHSRHRICKRVFICNSFREARRLADALKNNPRSGFSYVNIASRKPCYNSSRYCVTISFYKDFNHDVWMKYTNIPE